MIAALISLNMLTDVSWNDIIGNQTTDRVSIILCTPDSEIDDHGFCSKPAFVLANGTIRLNSQTKTMEIVVGNTPPNFLKDCNVANYENWVCETRDGEMGMREGRFYMRYPTLVATSLVGVQQWAYEYAHLGLADALRASGAPDWRVVELPNSTRTRIVCTFDPDSCKP